MRRVAIVLFLICILAGAYLFTVFIQQQYGVSVFSQIKKLHKPDPPPSPPKKEDPPKPKDDPNSDIHMFDEVDISEKGSVVPELSKILEADSIRIDNNWTGYVGTRKASYDLSKSENSFGGPSSFFSDGRDGQKSSTATINIPLTSANKFLQLLSNTPVIEKRYKPRLTHTDSYPDITITLQTKNEIFVFWSKSQGEGRIPWGVKFGGKEYVANVDNPELALNEIYPYLKQK